eukprot:TRINITY_DN1728_c0_g1_i2.p1 TRINITY_DN1728_c0_g1~~TRINITY_DN1728_c0_g1_i2.p1  ORF type:complete len:282 (-),score=-0.56 TRINITY_DN1728_c0_g1_i2:279-1001(-)
MEETKNKGVEQATVAWKSSTTSSIMIGSTITKPDVKLIVQAVAAILHSQINDDQNFGKKIKSCSDLYYFCEEKYIKEKPEEFDEARLALLKETPTVENMYEFLMALYDCAQFRYYYRRAQPTPQSGMLHNMLDIHKQDDSLYGNALTFNQLETFDFMFALSRPKGKLRKLQSEDRSGMTGTSPMPTSHSSTPFLLPKNQTGSNRGSQSLSNTMLQLRQVYTLSTIMSFDPYTNAANENFL